MYHFPDTPLKFFNIKHGHGILITPRRLNNLNYFDLSAILIKLPTLSAFPSMEFKLSSDTFIFKRQLTSCLCLNSICGRDGTAVVQDDQSPFINQCTKRWRDLISHQHHPKLPKKYLNDNNPCLTLLKLNYIQLGPVLF